MTPDTLFQIANSVALIGWVVLLASPFQPQMTQRVSSVAIPLLLAVAYVGLLFVYWSRAEGGFDTLANVMRLFTVPELVLAGWIHYLAFDLFVGAWEVRTARAEHIPFVLVIPCLALTFMFGPAGLLAFSALRGARSLMQPKTPPDGHPQ